MTALAVGGIGAPAYFNAFYSLEGDITQPQERGAVTGFVGSFGEWGSIIGSSLLTPLLWRAVNVSAPMALDAVVLTLTVGITLIMKPTLERQVGRRTPRAATKGCHVPELPEVETIRRQLEPLVTGHTVKRARALDRLTVAPLAPAGFARRMAGRRIEALTRRGKYLFFELADGGALMVHLRMTGRLTHFEAGAERPGAGSRHLRLVLELDDGSAVTLHDQRRFGKALILSPPEIEALMHRLGPEPLERGFNAHSLAGVLRNRKRAVKSVLLDQQRIAGIGNIYADEALFVPASIRSARPARSRRRRSASA